MMNHSRLFAWPGWAHIGHAIALGIAFSLWFAVIYGGADFLAGLRDRYFRVHLDAELALPFVPMMSVFYMSIYPLFWCAPFVLRTVPELQALALTLATVTLVAGLFFLVLPSELAFAPPQVDGIWRPVFVLADRLNLRYNLFPSLHVALSVTCASAYALKTTLFWRSLFTGWAALISASTVLTHQHHLADVAGGVILGIAASRLVYPRFVFFAGGRQSTRSVE